MTKPGDVDHYTRVRCYQALMPSYPHQHGDARRCCRSPCGWAGRARRCGTRSSARTTAAPTSSSAATTRARATTRAASRSTARTTRRSCSGAREGAGRRDGALPDTWSTSRTGHLRPRGRGAAGRTRARHLGDRAPAAAGRGTRDPELVHVPGGREGAARARHPPRDRQGFTVFFTGLSGSGKSTIANVLLVKLLETGRSPGDAAGRRHRAQESLLGAGLLEGAPRHQHPAHRVRGLRDHEERRHRDLRADRAVRRASARTCAR